jgi:hypothetical protein
MFEEQYNRIGWRTGPFATRDARQAVKEFWINSGQEGVDYLVERLNNEFHIDLIEGVSSLLVDIGPRSIDPIVQALNRPQSKRDNTDILLKTLGWIGISLPIISKNSLADTYIIQILTSEKQHAKPLRSYQESKQLSCSTSSNSRTIYEILL